MKERLLLWIFGQVSVIAYIFSLTLIISRLKSASNLFAFDLNCFVKKSRL